MKKVIPLVLSVLFLLTFVSIPASALPGTGKVSGTVTDSIYGGPIISGATVKLYIGGSLKDTDTTGSDGKYLVSCFVEYKTLAQVKVSKDGYYTKTSTCYIEPNKETIRKVYLLPSNPLPAAVAGLSANILSHFEIELDWDDNTDLDFNYYRICRNGAQIATESTRSDSHYLDNTLTPETTYWYSVSVVDTIGQEGPSASITDLTTPEDVDPAQVTGLTAEAISTINIYLSWDEHNERDFYRYRIYRDSNYIGMCETNFYSDSNLSPNTRYIYRVSILDMAGNEGLKSDSATATTYPIPVPEQVTGLVTCVVSDTSIQISWTPNPTSDLVERYHIYQWNYITQNFTCIDETTECTYTESGLLVGVWYCYRVCAENSFGLGPPSARLFECTSDSNTMVEIQNVGQNDPTPDANEIVDDSFTLIVKATGTFTSVKCYYNGLTKTMTRIGRTDHYKYAISNAPEGVMRIDVKLFNDEIEVASDYSYVTVDTSYRYDLLLEIDCLEGYYPSSGVLSYLILIYRERGINVTYVISNTTIQDPNPSDGYLSHEEFWQIEAQYNNKIWKDDRAYGNKISGKYDLNEKYVLYANYFYDPTDADSHIYLYKGCIEQDPLAAADDKLGNYIRIYQGACEHYENEMNIASNGAEITALCHEVGHSLGIFVSYPSGTEKYDSDWYSIMSTVKIEGAVMMNGFWYFSSEYWHTVNIL